MNNQEARLRAMVNPDSAAEWLLDDADREAVRWILEAKAELLEACKGLLMCSLPRDISGQRFIDAAHAAIARASGGPS